MNKDQISNIANTLKAGDIIEIKCRFTVQGEKNETHFDVKAPDGYTESMYISQLAASDAEISVISRAIPKEPNSLAYNLHDKHLLVLDKYGVPWRKGYDGWQSLETNDIFEWEDMYKRFGPVTIYLPDKDV
jgi:hypothetical protein